MIHTTQHTHQHYPDCMLDLVLIIKLKEDREIISFDVLNKKTNKLMTAIDLGGTSFSKLLKLAYDNALASL